MDFIHTIMNLVAPPAALITLLFLLPPYLFFSFLRTAVRRFFCCENVAGKVVIITGASSGIGEQLAYEYARRGACLALIARREKRLNNVAGKSRLLGSPGVIVIPADVSKLEDCQLLVEETVKHFGRNHLVNNAGVATINLFEESAIKNFDTAMDTNFWGQVHTTYFAIPHLRRSKGKIIVMASACVWIPVVRMSIYRATKAAVMSFFETMRIELGPEIGITIVTPGLIDSEMTQGKFLCKDGSLVLDQEMRDVQEGLMPIESASECARAIVKSACCGDKTLTMPPWMRSSFFWMMFLPEVVERMNHVIWSPKPGTSPKDVTSKRVLDLIHRFSSYPK